MASVDLNAEMNRASDRVAPEAMKAAGLDPETVWAAGGLGIVRGETFKDGTYQPIDDGGQWLWVAPCFYGIVRPEMLDDLVAWSPGDPARWWRRKGNGMVLGFANVQKARQTVWDFGYGDPPPPPTLTLHKSPRDYVMAGFEGACILDWTHGPGELEGVERVICKCLGFAELVERAFIARSPQRPAVLVADRMELA